MEVNNEWIKKKEIVQNNENTATATIEIDEEKRMQVLKKKKRISHLNVKNIQL